MMSQGRTPEVLDEVEEVAALVTLRGFVLLQRGCFSDHYVYGNDFSSKSVILLH